MSVYEFFFVLWGMPCVTFEWFPGVIHLAFACPW